MFIVAAINSLYVALGSPLLEGWKATGGDPCLEQWEGVSCVFSNITALYVPPHFLKLFICCLVLSCVLFSQKSVMFLCGVFLSCIIDEGECDHLVYGSIKFVYLGWQTAGRHEFKRTAGE